MLQSRATEICGAALVVKEKFNRRLLLSQVLAKR
jgi:hypothetical protein